MVSVVVERVVVYRGWLERPAWPADAACRGHDAALFFPETGEYLRQAHALCETCRVRVACCTFALADASLQGVWAGTTPKQWQHARADGWDAARLLAATSTSERSRVVPTPR